MLGAYSAILRLGELLKTALFVHYCELGFFFSL